MFVVLRLGFTQARIPPAPQKVRLGVFHDDTIRWRAVPAKSEVAEGAEFRYTGGGG